MKKLGRSGLIGLILICIGQILAGGGLFALPGYAATVTGNTQDQGLGNLVTNITFKPLNLQASRPTIFTMAPITVQSDSSGNFSRVLLQGDYSIQIGGNARDSALITVPSGTNTYNWVDLLTSDIVIPAAGTSGFVPPVGVKGDLLACDGTNWFRLALGTQGYVLTVDTNQIYGLTYTASGGGAGSGTVTSVGFTAFAGLSISGSPVTGAGTIALSTTLNGVLKGNGSGFTTANGGTDYEYPLSFSAPLSRSGNTISIPQGTGSVDGFILHTDWSTFNSKVGTSRTINTTSPLIGGGDFSADRTLSLAGLTGLGTANQMLGMNAGASAYEYKSLAVGTSGSDFAIANSAGALTFNLPTASGSNRGALSSADWTTFNSKQAAVSVTLPLTLTGASIGMVNQGTTSQVLIGNATGNPSFGSVNLSTMASGTLQAAQEPAHTGDVTGSAGSLVLTLGNIPTGVTQAGKIIATAITAPSTPAAGTGSLYVDSTSKNWAVKDDAGIVHHGVQTIGATANQWITAIADDGSGTKAQPSFSNISGTLGIGAGGTGQTGATAAFDALSPETTKGDLIIFDGTHNARLGVGSNTQVLTADSTQTTGVKWAAAGGGISPLMVSTTFTNMWTNSTTTMADVTGFAVTITPQSSSSKIMVTVALNAGGASGTYWQWRVNRSGSEVAPLAATLTSQRSGFQCVVSGADVLIAQSITFVDAPATTSAVTYQVQFCAAFSGPAYLNKTSLDSTTTYEPRATSYITAFSPQ